MISDEMRAEGWVLAKAHESLKEQLAAIKRERAEWVSAAIDGGATQKECAEILGVDPSTVRHLLGLRPSNYGRYLRKLRERDEEAERHEAEQEAQAIAAGYRSFEEMMRAAEDMAYGQAIDELRGR